MATKAMPVQPAINIRVLKNGDEFYTGKRFVISTRTTKDFDSFLNEVTSGLKASFGAVRKLHTPVNGHKIQDLSGLENNNIYVAAGTEKFKRKSYTEHSSPRRLAAGTVKASTFAGPIQPVTHSKIRRSARIRHIYVGTKSIYLYRNGDDKELPIRMLLRYRALQNFETVLTEINGKVNLLNGVAVRRLYKMNGERVLDCSQLDSDGKYVVAGTERFKKVAYGQWEPAALSPRLVKKPLPPIKAKPAPQKSSLPAKPKPTTVKKRPEKKKKRPEKSPEQKEADSVFHHKPTTVKRSRERDQHLNYEDDPNAVFKAKEGNSETDGAREIEDTRETAVDLPIDQIAAEEVDEEIGGEDLPLAQESKSPESQPTRHETVSPQKASAVPEQLPEDFHTEEQKTHSPEEKGLDLQQKKRKSIQTTTQGTKISQATMGKSLPTAKRKTPLNQSSSVKKPSANDPPETPVQSTTATSPQNPPSKMANPPTTTKTKTPTPPPKATTPSTRMPTPPPKSATPQLRTTPTEKKMTPSKEKETTPQPEMNRELSGSNQLVKELTKSPTNDQQKESYDFDVTKPELISDVQNGTLANAQDVTE